MGRFLKVLQRWFFTGLLVWAPFIATIFVFVWAFNLLDGWVQPLANKVLKRPIPGLGLGILVISTLTIGAVVSNFIGKRLVSIIESLLLRVPAFNVVYKLLRDLSGTFLNRDSKGGFREVVAVRFPSAGMWAVGFITGPVPPALEAGVSGGAQYVQPVESGSPDERVLVFIMQAFSPATGTLIAVHRRETVKLDMPVDEAVKLILTGGLVKKSNPGADPGTVAAIVPPRLAEANPSAAPLPAALTSAAPSTS